MTTVLEWISEIAPLIDANNSVDKKTRFISVASSEVNRSLFSNEETYNMALAYYVCHLLSLTSQDSSIRGTITMEKEGDLQKSYSSFNSNQNTTNTTQYLDTYNSLIKNRTPNFYISHGCKSN